MDACLLLGPSHLAVPDVVRKISIPRHVPGIGAGPEWHPDGAPGYRDTVQTTAADHYAALAVA